VHPVNTTTLQIIIINYQNQDLQDFKIH
jgi:hypothetical protein